MSEAHFTLVFRGPAVENGEIDVRDLAPALLAAGDLFQAANDVINGADARVSVRVRATAAACFEVDLSVWQDLVDSILTYAKEHQDGIAAANELADLLLKAGGGIAVAAGGLFKLLKWLKGRKPEKIEQKEGGTHIHIGDNYFVADPRVVKLAENLAVRENARKLVSLLERDGIDSISIRQKHAPEMQIGRDEVRSFDVKEGDDLELQDETRRMTLQIISLSFKEDNKWRLTDGAEPFTATIEDADFLRKIANDEIVFGKSDYLVCDVRERQLETQRGLKKERTIVRVHEHRQAGRQLKLM